MEGIVVENIGDRKICLKGVGKLFYEQGFPISMAVSKLKLKGIEVSILHVADECLKNGWPAKTTISKLTEDFQDTQDAVLDVVLLKEFCYSSYERQREMIFYYLFINQEVASNWLLNKF